MAKRPSGPSDAGLQNRTILGTLTKRERSPQGGFDLYEIEPPLEFYVDGATQVMAGPHVCKIMFHRVEGTVAEEGNVEQRRPVVSIAMPTAALVQMCAFLTNQMQASSEVLLAGLEETRKLYSSFGRDVVEAELRKVLEGMTREISGSQND